MNDYLSTLATRALRPAETLQPRHASMFEPVGPGVDGVGSDAMGSNTVGLNAIGFDTPRMGPPGVDASGMSAPSHAAGSIGEAMEHHAFPANREEQAGSRYASTQQNRAAASSPGSSLPEFSNNAPWRLDQVVRRPLPRMENRDGAPSPDAPVHTEQSGKMSGEIGGEMQGEMKGAINNTVDAGGIFPLGRAAVLIGQERMNPLHPDALHPDAPYSEAQRSDASQPHQDEHRSSTRRSLNLSTIDDDGEIIQPEKHATLKGGAMQSREMEYREMLDRERRASISHHVGSLEDAPAAHAGRSPQPLPHLVPNVAGASPERTESPTIRVTIGRIDVRAIMPQAPPPEPPAPKRAAGLSLDDYLRAQKRGYQ